MLCGKSADFFFVRCTAIRDNLRRLRKLRNHAIAAPLPQGVCNTPLHRNPNFAFFVAILLFGCGFAASIFTHDDAIFGMGGRADRLAGLESLGWWRDDV